MRRVANAVPASPGDEGTVAGALSQIGAKSRRAGGRRALIGAREPNEPEVISLVQRVRLRVRRIADAVSGEPERRDMVARASALIDWQHALIDERKPNEPEVTSPFHGSPPASSVVRQGLPDPAGAAIPLPEVAGPNAAQFGGSASDKRQKL